MVLPLKQSETHIKKQHQLGSRLYIETIAINKLDKGRTENQ